MWKLDSDKIPTAGVATRKSKPLDCSASSRPLQWITLTIDFDAKATGAQNH